VALSHLFPTGTTLPGSPPFFFWHIGYERIFFISYLIAIFAVGDFHKKKAAAQRAPSTKLQISTDFTILFILHIYLFVWFVYSSLNASIGYLCLPHAWAGINPIKST